MAIWRPSRYLFDQRLSSPGASPSGGFAPLGRSALAIFHLLIRADRPIRPTAVATDASRSLPGSGSAHHYIALRLRGLSESPPRSRSAGVQADELVREGRRHAAICRGARAAVRRGHCDGAVRTCASGALTWYFLQGAPWLRSTQRWHAQSGVAFRSATRISPAPNTATVRDVLRRGHPCRRWSLIFDTPARGSRTIRATART